MVFNRILFNNIKEYTPTWMKTIPNKQTVRPNLTRVHNFNTGYTGTSYGTFLRFFRENVQKKVGNYHLFIFLFSYKPGSFAMTYTVFTPFLFIYQSNNSHRSLDKAIEVEKAYKKKKAEEEEAEGSE